MAARFITTTQVIAEELVRAAEAAQSWQASAKCEAIRVFRKRTKLMRAALGVLGRGEDRAVCEAMLEILGEANRLLSPLRDHDVLRRTIRLAGALFPDEQQRSVRTVLSTALLLHARAHAEITKGDDRAFEDAVLTRVVKAAHRVRTAVKSLAGLELRRREIAASIESKWKSARGALRAAIVTRELALLHAARKEIAAVAGCIGAWQGTSEPSRRVTRFRRRLARIAQSLGEDRDFALLADRLVLERTHIASEEMLEDVLNAILVRRKQIHCSIRRDAKQLVKYRQDDLHTMLLDDLS